MSCLDCLASADGERVKRRRRGQLPLVPAPGGAVDGAHYGGGMAPLPLRRARSDTATATASEAEALAEGEQLADEDEFEQPMPDDMMVVEEDEEGAFGGAMARGLVNPFKQPQLQQQVFGGRARADINTGTRSGGTEQEEQQGTDLFAEGEELDPMDEDTMMGLDGIEYERWALGGRGGFAADSEPGDGTRLEAKAHVMANNATLFSKGALYEGWRS